MEIDQIIAKEAASDPATTEHQTDEKPPTNINCTESGIQDMGSRGLGEMNSILTASRTSLVRPPSDSAFMHIKLDSSSVSQASLRSKTSASTSSCEEPDIAPQSSTAVPDSGIVSPEHQHEHTKENRKEVSSLTSAPLKSTNFGHLRQKYIPELEYMLTEFKKLERQLLGAKAATRESAGSRERREKLHSFILHLEDTIQQIHTGCQLEAEGKSTIQEPMEDSALIQLTQEKKEEENVQKLEEHILANLLPVKVRLKKQLAAQQGAKHNPAGMPVRGSMVTTKQDKGKATFAVGGEKPSRRLSTGSSHFGKPLDGGGSSLTQKLHGSTLGSSSRTHGHGVGAKEKSEEQEGSKIIFAGMAIGSDQIESSVDAANAAHKMVINDPAFLELASFKPGEATEKNDLSVQPTLPEEAASSNAGVKHDPALVELQRRRLKRKKRKRKRKALEEEEEEKRKEFEAKKPPLNNKRKKGAVGGKKRGPRAVEYMCALCNEVYASTCEHNPWWALTQHECPKCRKTQIPRVDISAIANAIEYHPALLAHADEHGGGAAAASELKSSAAFPTVSVAKDSSDADSLGSDLSDEDWEGILSDDDSMGSDQTDAEALVAMSPAEKAEIERFGKEYSGPKLSDQDSARLLILMAHASTCPCQHKLAQQRDVCRNTKWMMLHVRDCQGTTSTFDVCPFPWCRKVKHLLYHLVTCQEQELCAICSPTNINSSLVQLNGLNEHRLKRYRERLVARMKVATAARCKPVSSKSSKPPTNRASVPNKRQQYRKPGPTVTAATAVKPGPPNTMVTAAAPAAAVKTESTSSQKSTSTKVPVRGAVAIAEEKPILAKVKAEDNFTDVTSVANATTTSEEKDPMAKTEVEEAEDTAAMAKATTMTSEEKSPALVAKVKTEDTFPAFPALPHAVADTDRSSQARETDTKVEESAPVQTSKESYGDGEGSAGSPVTVAAPSSEASMPDTNAESSSTLQNCKVPDKGPATPSPILSAAAAVEGEIPFESSLPNLDLTAIPAITRAKASEAPPPSAPGSAVNAETEQCSGPPEQASKPQTNGEEPKDDDRSEQDVDASEM